MNSSVCEPRATDSVSDTPAAIQAIDDRLNRRNRPQPADVRPSTNDDDGNPSEAIQALHAGRGIRSLALGRLPNGMQYVARLTNKLRKQLEDAVFDAKGDIDLTDSATIQSACRWERHALVVARWLRDHADDMGLGMRLQYSREVAKASSERDACIRALGIQREEPSVIDALYS